MAEKSKINRETIERWWTDNPCRFETNGNLITGPVRLAFTYVLVRPKPGADGKDRAYGTVLMFPELGGPVVLNLMQKAVTDLFKDKAPQALANKELMAKFNNPFKKQDTYVDPKTGELYDGFVAGRFAIPANTQSKPSVVDMNLAPIVDMAKVYSGCWAICSLRPAWFDVGSNKGATFYLQSVMVVADDENLGGVGASNPNKDFASVKIDPTVAPDALFGASGPSAGSADAGEVNLFD